MKENSINSIKQLQENSFHDTKDGGLGIWVGSQHLLSAGGFHQKK